MNYLKVKWIHQFNDEPMLIFIELAEDRSEIRKVELFSDGTYGFASHQKSKGTTRLSDSSIPLEEEIGRDPQFVPESIDRVHFEKVWQEAIDSANN